MIVKCNENRLEKVSNDATSDFLLEKYRCLNGEIGLKVGQCYVVYSLFVADSGFRWYFLRSDSKHSTWYSEIFFEVIDTIPSEYWMTFWIDGISDVCEKGKIYTFPEFTERGDEFYINLVEGCRQEVEIFNGYVQKMKNEAIL